MKTRLLLILTFLITCALQAGPRQALVVDAAWLKAHLNDPDLVLLHVGDKDGYAAGHIPGARLVSLNDISVSDHSGHGLMLEMPPADDLRHRLQSHLRVAFVFQIQRAATFGVIARDAVEDDHRARFAR